MRFRQNECLREKVDLFFLLPQFCTICTSTCIYTIYIVHTSRVSFCMFAPSTTTTTDKAIIFFSFFQHAPSLIINNSSSFGSGTKYTCIESVWQCQCQHTIYIYAFCAISLFVFIYLFFFICSSVGACSSNSRIVIFFPFQIVLSTQQ